MRSLPYSYLLVARRLAGGLAFCVALATTTAFADSGDVSVGGYVGSNFSHVGRAGLSGRIGLSDWWAMESQLGAQLVDKSVGFEATVAPVLAWDVIAWVPELKMGVGLTTAGEAPSPFWFATLGVRKYVALSWSVGVAGSYYGRFSSENARVPAVMLELFGTFHLE